MAKAATTRRIVDFEYRLTTDGWATIFPNTPDAMKAYNHIFVNGAVNLTHTEMAQFKIKARSAGFTVRKLQETCTLANDDLLAALAEPDVRDCKDQDEELTGTYSFL